MRQKPWNLLILILLLTAIFTGMDGMMAESSPKSLRGVEKGGTMDIKLRPIGRVVCRGERMFLDLLPEFAPALLGIGDFSHIWVFFWFHENDYPEARRTLQVHPRRDPANPLTGVFATRSPERPNLIGLTACRLVEVTGHVLEVADLDAWDGTPILDLKPYIPQGDSIPEARIPAWVPRKQN